MSVGTLNVKFISPSHHASVKISRDVKLHHGVAGSATFYTE